MTNRLGYRLGDLVRKIRQGRGLTQDLLAERSDLSVDAIRRLERGAFSPSLETLQKLSTGLELSLRTLFADLEEEPRQPVMHICDYLASRSRAELALAWRVIRAMFDER